MSEENIKKTIEENILETIKNRHLSMHSKFYFLLRAILFFLGVVIIFLGLLYLASFIAFYLFETGVWFMPVFGMHGWLVFFRSLPWILIFFLMAFILVMEIMVRQYSFAYRRPLLYSILGIVFITIIGGFIVSEVSLHRRFLDYARSHRIPGVGRVYHSFGMPTLRDIHRGTIRELFQDHFILENRDGTTSSITIVSSTRMPRRIRFMMNDSVVILGKKTDSEIQAIGVNRIFP